MGQYGKGHEQQLRGKKAVIQVRLVFQGQRCCDVRAYLTTIVDVSAAIHYTIEKCESYKSALCSKEQTFLVV